MAEVLNVLFPGFVLALLLLALTGVFTKRRIENEVIWDERYMQAIVRNPQNWYFGWRLEDLAQQTTNQRNRILALLDAVSKVPHEASTKFALKETGGIRGAGAGLFDGRLGDKSGIGDGDAEETLRGISLAKVLAEEEDLNRLVMVSCATRPGKFLQVGMHSMVASQDDACKVYSAAIGPLGPHSLFEKMDLGEGQFALRAFSNGRYLRVNPPALSEDEEVWFLEVGSPEIGLPEIFRMRDGMVYSDIMRGYLSCSGAGREAELKGFVGEYLWQDPANYELLFRKASESAVERARMLRDLSNTVHAAQSQAGKDYEVQQAIYVESNSKKSAESSKQTIALCVPMTSRGTLMNRTSDSPLWDHSYRTFLAVTDWLNPTFRYHWYLGFDEGDDVYDGAQARERLRDDFAILAMQEFATQGLGPETANHLLRDVLRLTPLYFTDLEHAPSRVVSELIRQAYDDGCDYFYQINDDSIMKTRGWAETLTGVLRNNPLGRNVGVTGPTDTNNVRILTHAFVHRTHLEIFGRFFPYSFMNWWSDDWISNVYGNDHTLRDHHVTVTHDVRSQKVGNNNRYNIDYLAQSRLFSELQLGHIKLSKWLAEQHMPPPALPMVCGYAPLIESVEHMLSSRWVTNPPSREGKEGKQTQHAGALVEAGNRAPPSEDMQPRKRANGGMRQDDDKVDPADEREDEESPDSKRQITTAGNVKFVVPSPPPPRVDEASRQAFRPPRPSESDVEDNGEGSDIRMDQVDQTKQTHQKKRTNVVVDVEGDRRRRKEKKEKTDKASVAAAGTKNKSFSQSKTRAEYEQSVAEALREVDGADEALGKDADARLIADSAGLAGKAGISRSPAVGEDAIDSIDSFDESEHVWADRAAKQNKENMRALAATRKAGGDDREQRGGIDAEAGSQEGENGQQERRDEVVDANARLGQADANRGGKNQDTAQDKAAMETDVVEAVSEISLYVVDRDLYSPRDAHQALAAKSPQLR